MYTKQYSFEQRRDVFGFLALTGELPSATQIRTYCGGRVFCFGVSPDGDITEDRDARNGHTRTSVAALLQDWFRELSLEKDHYAYYPSLNEDVEIYAPVSLDHELALEYISLSGSVDTEASLNVLFDRTKQMAGEELTTISNVLSGRNYWHSLNLAIDFQHKVLIARKSSRLSINGSLALTPIFTLARAHNFQTEERIRPPYINITTARSMAIKRIQGMLQSM